MNRLDPINDPFNESLDEEITFPCACGDPSCVGRNDDSANIRIGSSWYSADCPRGQFLWNQVTTARTEFDDLFERR